MMGQLFQERVLEKFIDDQNDNIVRQRWGKLQEFQSKVNAKKNDKKSDIYREQEYQTGFLIDVFENCLGYKLNINTGGNDFNLRREVKNESDSKRADGVIIVDNNIVGVIELKAQDTKYLNRSTSKNKTPVEQAFGYLTAHKIEYAKYVIVSNFDELRFYIQDRTSYEKFCLFDMTYSSFKRLHTILSFESISHNLPIEIKQKSVIKEQEITDELYKAYTEFRNDLFETVKSNNTTVDEVKLLSLTQKLIDRIVFILFAEDTNILPINTISTIIEDFKSQRLTNFSLYDIYKIYFRAIDKGSKKLGITPYNGGLFAKDELLDSLIIDDDVLKDNAIKLSTYRFGSDISVNILGHIFEKSITALEEITAQIQHTDYDKKKSQQKIDGAFYTPEYITRYIVDNTLGQLCIYKKTELCLDDMEEPRNPKNLTNKEKSNLETIYQYRDWLLNLKILDPACGSGAFLNQALVFLLAEHKFIDDNRRLYENEGLGLYDIKANILKNNLYGVDINEGAVDIAKLSLWLSTAKPGEPLTALAEKIKVGNSLIDDKSMSDNAFVWENEFPEVFAQGGFDVIMGNPPYITFALGKEQEFNNKDIEYYKDKFPLASVYKVSSYLIFIERSLALLSKKGLLSFIVPNAFHTNYYYRQFREYLIDKYSIHSLFNLDYEVFEDADTGGLSIFILGKDSIDKTKLFSARTEEAFQNPFYFELEQEKFKNMPDNKFLFSDNLISIWNKSFVNSIPLGNDNFQFYQGIITGNNKKFLSEKKLDDRYKPIIRGRDFYKYTPLENQFFVLFDPEKLWSNTNKNMYNVNEKLIFRQTSDHLVATYDNEQKFSLDSTHIFFDKSNKFNHKYLLAIINSKLLNFLYQIIVPEVGKIFSQVKGVNLKKLPIKLISEEGQNPFIQKADLMLDLNKTFQAKKQKFLNRIMDNFDLDKFSKKLNAFYELDFKTFLRELKKKKVILTLKDQDEWEEYFDDYKNKLLKNKARIDAIDEEIDEMVYELYNLTEEEINIIDPKPNKSSEPDIKLSKYML